VACLFPWLSIHFYPDHLAAIRRGRSREPLVFTPFGRINDERKSCEGGGRRAKAAPLQALGNYVSRLRANPFEDEDEYD
jgi:hypothetical protein